MAKQGGGVIVNPAFIVATVGCADRTAYRAARAAAGGVRK
jgi:NAD(P)-dependent dehydrogenase (short-subunit alcohol dehydrogenase family)